ncbi:MAG: septum formation initiator family protein [Gemmatimonadota bacterium]|nr:septum formation initiator family protein [Gemmatimonadota bacterium]
MKSLLWILLIVVALYFGLQGGEYSTRDLYVLRARSGSLQREVDSLQRRVDSLTRYLRAVKVDSATQERIAREEFGMIRGNKEMLYRFGDSARR